MLHGSRWKCEFASKRTFGLLAEVCHFSLFLLAFSAITVTFKDIQLNRVVHAYSMCCVALPVSEQNKSTRQRHPSGGLDSLLVLGKPKLSFSLVCGPTGKLSPQPQVSWGVYTDFRERKFCTVWYPQKVCVRWGEVRRPWHVRCLL